MGNSAGNIMIWDTETSSLEDYPDFHGNLISWISFSPFNNKIASCDYSGELIIFDFETRSVDWKIKCKSPATSCTFLDNGKIVLAGTKDGELILHDTLAASEIARVDLDGEIWAVDFIEKDRVFLICVDDTLILIDRSFPVYWWGHFCRIEVWVAIALGLIWIWRIRGWVREKSEKRVSAVEVQPVTTPLVSLKDADTNENQKPQHNE